VLDIPQLTLGKGRVCGLIGPSGSGKSTLLSLLSGIDLPTEGSVSLFGTELKSLSEDERSAFRLRNIGFIFQNFQLIEHLSAFENVTLPAELLGQKNFRERAEVLLAQVGMSARRDHLPSQLSGGEQQRVALARAFISEPQLILADEPTGNLDLSNARVIYDILLRLSEEKGVTVIVATHDLSFASALEVRIELRGGRLVNS